MSKWILLSSLCVEKNLSQSVNLLNLSSKFLFSRRKPKYLTTSKEFTSKTVLQKILISDIIQKRLRWAYRQITFGWVYRLCSFFKSKFFNQFIFNSFNMRNIILNMRKNDLFTIFFGLYLNF